MPVVTAVETMAVVAVAVVVTEVVGVGVVTMVDEVATMPELVWLCVPDVLVVPVLVFEVDVNAVVAPPCPPLPSSKTAIPPHPTRTVTRIDEAKVRDEVIWRSTKSSLAHLVRAPRGKTDGRRVGGAQ